MMFRALSINNVFKYLQLAVSFAFSEISIACHLLKQSLSIFLTILVKMLL